MEEWNGGRMEEWNVGIMERLSELESENLMSRLWEGPWERIIMECWKSGIMPAL